MREEGPGWTDLLSIQGIWKKHNVKERIDLFIMLLFFLSRKGTFHQDFVLTCWLLWTRWICRIHTQATPGCCQAGSWRARRPTSPGDRCPGRPALPQSRHDKDLDRGLLQRRSLYPWSHSSGFQGVQCSRGKPGHRIMTDELGRVTFFSQ